jgi:hypothetical protein
MLTKKITSLPTHATLKHANHRTNIPTEELRDFVDA